MSRFDEIVSKKKGFAGGFDLYLVWYISYITFVVINCGWYFRIERSTAFDAMDEHGKSSFEKCLFKDLAYRGSVVTIASFCDIEVASTVGQMLLKMIAKAAVDKEIQTTASDK